MMKPASAPEEDLTPDQKDFLRRLSPQTAEKVRQVWREYNDDEVARKRLLWYDRFIPQTPRTRRRRGQ
jgi:hypothetical protein